MTIVAVWINCPNQQVAQHISDVLVKERLAASTNIFTEVQSAFHWKGNVRYEKEVPVLAKTREELFQVVRKRVRELHPYETPGILATAVHDVDREYEIWVRRETVLESK